MRISLAAALTLACSSSALKVGFLGDSGAKDNAARSFKIMRDKGVQLVVQNGDLDYDSDPAQWDSFLSANWYNNPVNTDIIVTSGNHEDDFISTILSGGKKWETRNGYKERMYNNLMNRPGPLQLDTKCKAVRKGKSLREDYGNYMACETDDVLFITIGWNQISDSLTGAGGDQDEVNAFLLDALSSSNAKWKVCTWHRPEGVLNPGDRHTSNFKTQRAYDICRQFGAFVTSGHTHVYARSKLIKDFSTMEVSADHATNATQVQLQCGESFSVVNGMAGKSMDSNGKYASSSWFHKIYTSNTGSAENGVFVCDFQAEKADCEFLVGDGQVHDAFSVYPPADTATCLQVRAREEASVDPDDGSSESQSCLRDYSRAWALSSPSQYSWCGNSCCAGKSADQPCYYTVPNPADCGAPSSTEIITSARVREGIDDVEEYNGGRLFFQPDAFYTDSTDIEFVDDSLNGRKGQLVGLRFQGVQVPANAVITDAYLTLSVDGSDSGIANGFRIVADRSPNSEPWSTENPPSKRAFTNNVAPWDNVAPWVWKLDATNTVRSASFTSVVQEVVNLDGWSAGNAISIVVKDGSGKRGCKAFEKSPSEAALLVIKFENADAIARASMVTTAVGASAGVAVVALGVVGFIGYKRKAGTKRRLSAVKVDEEALEVAQLPHAQMDQSRRLSL